MVFYAIDEGVLHLRLEFLLGVLGCVLLQVGDDQAFLVELLFCVQSIEGVPLHVLERVLEHV